ncbi:Hypothetical protein ORPV_324 [Orpheovirus IHUMI-LCC2]|uniref:Uncharacterized protein n=1 Tax=Orpheovirus IHUMI-LCC2 TaxID=2023057 RepID=A0A2I2L3X5_9VIRU|nr:Hypothetical protein ORPV_324 [Orpheovirus IHUMI-LCC2]SNW62228.1 Hypothetical protein ORPV_324 [Orpheovirus IHUMI-LCC2]
MRNNMNSDSLEYRNHNKFGKINISMDNGMVMLTGDTYAVKEIIKRYGYKYDGNSKSWHMVLMTSPQEQMVKINQLKGEILEFFSNKNSLSIKKRNNTKAQKKGVQEHNATSLSLIESNKRAYQEYRHPHSFVPPGDCCFTCGYNVFSHQQFNPRDPVLCCPYCSRSFDD